MTEETENKKRSKSGDGSEGAASGSRSSVVFSVDATKLKEIMANWRRMDVSETISAVAEFFNEIPARASANLQVAFESSSKLGFAVINRFITFGQDLAGAMRTRSREATAQVRRKYGINIKTKKQGVTIIAPNPGVG